MAANNASRRWRNARSTRRPSMGDQSPYVGFGEFDEGA
jgi:hypothetical protein